MTTPVALPVQYPEATYLRDLADRFESPHSNSLRHCATKIELLNRDLNAAHKARLMAEQRLSEAQTVTRAVLPNGSIGDLMRERDAATAYAVALHENLDILHETLVGLSVDYIASPRCEIVKRLLAHDGDAQSFAKNPNASDHGSTGAAGAQQLAEAAGPIESGLKDLTIQPAGVALTEYFQPDAATVEHAIAYCKGQAMACRTTRADYDYDRGVAACVRILEDMMPMPEVSNQWESR